MGILRDFGEMVRGSIARERGALLLLMLFGVDSLLVFSLVVDWRVGVLYSLAKVPLYYFAGLFLPALLVVLAGFIKWTLVRRLIVGAVVIFYGIIATVDLFLWQKFGSLLDQTKIEILLGTNPYTVREFLVMYVGVAGFIALAVAVALIVWLMRRASRLLAKSELLVHAEAVVVVLAVLCAGVFWGGALFLPDKSATEAAKAGPGKSVMGGRLTNAIASTSLTRMTCDIRAALRALGNTELITASLDSRTEEIIADNGTAPYVIFILGESNDRNRMSAYGYERVTTPLLDTRLAAGEAVLFTDTIACANGTGQAMGRIFSFADKATATPWYENGCLIDIMNSAGYHTAWISNQSPSNRFGNMDGVLAGRSAERAFTSSDGSSIASKKRPFDSDLLPLLDESLAANTAARSFYVVHLTGTHEEYAQRYPEEFARFTAADEQGANDKQREVRAAYDNAMLYNDYMTDEIIKRFADKNAVIIYLSDHGSDVYDNDRDFMGHSDESLRNPHMIEIPMFVWGSASFWEAHSELKTKLTQAAARPYSTENVIHLILDLAGLKSTSYDSSKSILDPNNIYKTKPRLYGGEPYERGR